jgi:indolepyruvate ferredoxin oxidoreductase beta subunit
MSAPAKANVLIAAMGGEGGGVLADWILSAAQEEGLVVQSTSIPGVAQRTGATTYYIEMAAAPGGDVASARPVMSLYPVPGDIDVMVASELVEAGRAMENGFVTPDCTTLIASLHRVYAIAERGAMSDARFDAENILLAARELAKSRVMFDMDQTARENGSMINAVLLGAVAGCGRLPIPPARFEEAIRRQGVAVDRNLSAFHAGMEMAGKGEEPLLPSEVQYKRDWLAAKPAAASPLQRVERDFDPASAQILAEGVNRLTDYQNAAYAGRYLDRLARVRDAEAAAGGNGNLLRETARMLAVWMSYEDVIRVAQAKTRADRYDRIRQEVNAGGGEPLRVVEFLKPGAEEVASLLPRPLAEALLRNAESGGIAARMNVGLHIRSTTIVGFLLLRTLAGLRWLRPLGHRFSLEQAAIDEWIDAVVRAAGMDASLALEIALLPKLRKGYSDTFRRGRGNYEGIVQTLVRPTLAGEMAPGPAAQAVRRAREAALADPEGKALGAALADPLQERIAAE